MTILSNVALSEMQDEKRTHVHAVSTKEADTGAQLVAGMTSELDPAEAARVRKKIDYHILPMMCLLYAIQYVDKTTLGSAAILGIIQGAHLSTNQFNWLGTIFYISYLVFEYPQNLALQRFPVGRWMSINTLVWGVALICQVACTNFAGLFVCRLFLGICEGSTTAGFMIVSSMFYTRKEQTLRVGYWFLMIGTAQIISGLVSFGSLHIKTTRFAPWKWLMAITGIITLALAVLYWFLFPDSPTNAWFLTPNERVTAVQRLKENQTGVENKHFKKEQMMEALLDPKTWLFALYAAFDQVSTSITNQRQIIISSFGFSYLDTTLIGCAEGLVIIIMIWSCAVLATRIPNGRAYVSAMCYVPALVGVFLTQLLPWSNRVGLLFATWLVDMRSAAFALSLSWLTMVTTGHTKRITTNAIMLMAYCIGNAAGPFMWQAKYKPRNRVPWIIIGVCCAVCSCLLLAIRWMLARKNATRDAEYIVEEEVEYFIEKESESGIRVQVKVDKEFVDLTDRQNRDFRYML